MRPASLVARIPLAVKRFTPAPDPRRGGVKEAWSDPVPVLAYSVGPAYSTEPNGQSVVTSLTVGLPESYGIGPKDRVIWKGVEYAVTGELIDANQGPWPYTPGWVLTMQRAQS